MTRRWGRCRRRLDQCTTRRASRRGYAGARRSGGARRARWRGGAVARMQSGRHSAWPARRLCPSRSLSGSSRVRTEFAALSPLGVCTRLLPTFAELASRAQAEVAESDGAIKAMHPSRRGLDIAGRIARLREVAAESTPVLPPNKGSAGGGAEASARRQRAGADGESSEGYSADFASDSAGEAPALAISAAAAVAKVAPPQVCGLRGDGGRWGGI